MPIIVGAPRSGTTLLRLMVDAHPAIAIPPETHFLPACAGLARTPQPTAEQLINCITRSPEEMPAWIDFGLAEAAFAASVRGLQSAWSVRNGVRAFYRLYAESHGKDRAGDKTPGYVQHIACIAELLPEARFIHIIRDGRGAMASLREMWFAPSRDMADLARFWRDLVSAGRAAAAEGFPVLEVRYEALLETPEIELRRICAFVDLDFDESMLRYHERAAERLGEHRGRVLPSGEVFLTQEQRLAQQALVREPLQLSRRESWRQALAASNVHDFQVVAADLLTDLGYPLVPDGGVRSVVR
ncbi:MAG: sulfotransferase [Candidatus Eremiobacteraeota bacterium]|nr:sulfotransferase [Candidatus Eremiobacteraeota bacterium]